MCKKVLFSLLLIISLGTTYAQSTVTGTITTMQNEPLEGVSISIRNSYFGTTSGKDGSFSLQLSDTGAQTIQFSLMGYKTVERSVANSLPITIVNIRLKEEITEMKAVSITAGTFGAGQ